MNTIDKYQSLFILAAAALGLLLGQNPFISSRVAVLLNPLLMLMLFGMFLSVSFDRIKSSFLNFRFSISSLLINFVWTPLLAYALGAVFLSQQLPLWIGFVMLLLTPCTDWYLLFTAKAKGNVELASSILPINLLLQILLLPIYLLLFFNHSGSFELSRLAESVLMVLIIPFCFALLIRKSKKIEQSNRVKKTIIFFEQSQTLFLLFAIMVMFAANGSELLNNLNFIYLIFIPISIFFVVNYLLGGVVGRFLSFSYEDTVSLRMTTIARNSPLAVAIAATAFPTEPFVALTLVIGALVELPCLMLISQILLKTRNKEDNSRG